MVRAIILVVQQAIMIMHSQAQAVVMLVVQVQVKAVHRAVAHKQVQMSRF